MRGGLHQQEAEGRAATLQHAARQTRHEGCEIAKHPEELDHFSHTAFATGLGMAIGGFALISPKPIRKFPQEQCLGMLDSGSLIHGLFENMVVDYLRAAARGSAGP